MTLSNSPSKAIAPTLAHQAADWWLAAATKHDLPVKEFDPELPLEQRKQAAEQNGLSIGVIYVRQSAKPEHPLFIQLHDCIEHAAENSVYVPAEHVIVEASISGNRMRRPGLERLNSLLDRSLAMVVIVYHLSRLFRATRETVQFVQQKVVNQNCRLISVLDRVDTARSASQKGGAK